MKASVIICTLNRAKLLSEVVQAMTCQRVPTGGFEIVVVDNNSSDCTRDVTFRLAADSSIPIRYIFEKNLGLSFARNAGIAAAKGEILAFVDDDADVGPDWLCSLLAAFDDPDVACAGGPIRPQWLAAKPDWLTKDWEGYLGITEFEAVRETGVFHDPNYPWGGNMAFRKEIFQLAGFFPTDLGRIGTGLLGNEEISVCRRIEAIGRKISLVSDAVNFHKIPPERLTKQYFYHRTFYQGWSHAIMDLRSDRFDYARIRHFASSLFWQHLLQQGSLFDRKCRERLFIGYLSRAFAGENGRVVGGFRSLRALKTFLLETFKTAAAAVADRENHSHKLESLVYDEWLVNRDKALADQAEAIRLLEADRDNSLQVALHRQERIESQLRTIEELKGTIKSLGATRYDLERQVSGLEKAFEGLQQLFWVRLGMSLGFMKESSFKPTEITGRLTPIGESSPMDVKDLFWGKGPLLHLHDGEARSWQVTNEILEFIDAHVTSGSRTLETGAGVTTVLFAMKGCAHTCIVPLADEVDRIRQYCRDYGISVDQVVFEIDLSERVLPRMKPDPLDLVLIDGAHGFPVPLIDWYYTADRIKKGGLLILDDTQLWSVNILKQFLLNEAEWRLVHDIWPRNAIFEKVGEATCIKNEYSQPFVVKQTMDLLYPDHIEMIRPYVGDELISKHRAARQRSDASSER